MRDYRNDFLQEVALAFVGSNDQGTIVSTITRLLDKYELAERSTSLVLHDDVNAKMIRTYANGLVIDGKSEKTIEAYVRTLKLFAEFLDGKRLTDVCAFDIKNFLAKEKMRGVSNRTLENTRSHIVTFFAWMAAEEYIPKNSAATIKPIKYAEEVRLPFSQVEIDKLRSACSNKRDRAMIELLLATGVRVSEFCDLRIEDIDFSKKAIRIRHGKGNKERYTYFTDLAYEHLVSYLTEYGITSGPLFINKQKKGVAPGGVRHMLNVIAARAGVNDVHPHRFRRTFATGLASRGMDITEIQKLMGHTNINTTMIYVAMDDTQVEHSYYKFAV